MCVGGGGRNKTGIILYLHKHAYITQYGSTVYIGMAMGCSAL